VKLSIRKSSLTLAPSAYLFAAGCGIALVTFTGLILRDLPKIPGWIIIGKILSPLPIGAPQTEETFTPLCHQCPGKSGVHEFQLPYIFQSQFFC